MQETRQSDTAALTDLKHLLNVLQPQTLHTQVSYHTLSYNEITITVLSSTTGIYQPESGIG